MNTPPADITDGDIAAAATMHWGLALASPTYAAVGFGSHHWIADDSAGTRWFITVDGLYLKPWLGRDADTVFTALEQCYGLSSRLRVAGLAFVRAPVGPLVRLSDGYAMSMYPWIEGRAHDVGDFDDDGERDDVLRLLATLHERTDDVGEFPLRETFDIPCRPDLELTLTDDDVLWADGPFAGPARAAVVANRVELRHALDAYDDLVRSARHAEFVITHGESHAANWIMTATGPMLIDWDSPMLAPRERDLARVIGDDIDDAEAYGMKPEQDLLLLYRLWSDLKDVGCYVNILRQPHFATKDTREMLASLERVARFSESFPGLLD